MLMHANAWWSLQLHTLCALHTASRRPALASCAATVRPVYVQVQEGRLVQLGRLAAAVLEVAVLCGLVRSWEMCGVVHDQTCRSARNRQNNNPRRYRGM